MNWRKTDNSITIEDLQNVSKYLGVVFPTDFINFLIKNNHGRPEKPVFDTKKSKGRMLGALLNFNIRKEHSDNFFNVHEIVKDSIPHGFFPFASDPSGNYLCAEIKEGNIVNICLWNHELNFTVSSQNEIEKIDNSHTVEYISNTFDDFLNELYIPE